MPPRLAPGSAPKCRTYPPSSCSPGRCCSTIYALHNLEDVIADAEFLGGPASPHASRLVQLVEDVASLVAATVDGSIPRPYNGPGGAELRQIIFAVAQADGLR
jgi:hypothetical protein